ncbi:MAG: hypothetical protein JNM19_01440 [Chitinophagaceae bacterium]|nr:hypothetical protein [Chitinophagaceae bacterium]
MRSLSVMIIITGFFFYACKGTPARGLMEDIKHSDSAVVMYYHTPGDTRFFNMTRVKKIDSLAAIVKDVNTKPSPAKDSCITQGKIYFYGKGGAVYPVYFSRSGECMTLSFIKTGEKYFTSMSKEAKDILDDMEKRVFVFPGRQAE